ncbi:hypothetical protein FBQ82_09740 [Anaerolineae bacterium CFX7]|nr:hypothetical protein [Anaerolineae bacterium CFX7]
MTITIPTREPIAQIAFPDNLPVEDGEPLETNWHRIQINLLVDLTNQLWYDRTDFFAGGNMFIYYSARQALSRDYRGPDFFVVKDVEPKNERQVWKTWEEDGRLPDLIVELLSPSTAETDLTTKWRLYERTFRTPEYFAYDPDPKELRGWHLRERQYQEIIPDERGWFWSDELGVWLGLWEGEYERVQATWLRYYDQKGALLPTGEEAERKRAAQEALARESAEARARELEAEVARLRAEIARDAGRGTA